jgi:uncharacterized Ntn-hydrolase superfamily protein
MTFSIVGSCEHTGMAGVAITTSSIAVGSRCPHVLAGAGAVTTQNVTDPSIGPAVLALMAGGAAAPEAVAEVMEGRPHAQYRQVAAVDLVGGVAHVTGSEILGTHAVATGEGMRCGWQSAGNSRGAGSDDRQLRGWRCQAPCGASSGGVGGGNCRRW